LPGADLGSPFLSPHADKHNTADTASTGTKNRIDIELIFLKNTQFQRINQLPDQGYANITRG
jgi:hypothetical protein